MTFKIFLCKIQQKKTDLHEPVQKHFWNVYESKGILFETIEKIIDFEQDWKSYWNQNIFL